MMQDASKLPKEAVQAELAELQARLEANNTDVAALFQRARLYSSMKNYPLALEDLNSIVALRRQWVEAWVLRAETFALLKEYNAAFVNYEVAVKLDSRRAATYWSRARLYEYLAFASSLGKTEPTFRERHAQLALTDYSTAIRLEPTNHSYLRARARLFRELGDYQSAVGDYTQALEAEPENLATRQERAELYTRMSYNSQALTDYCFLIHFKPTSLLYEKRGLLYKALGDYRSALLDLTQAIELSPDSPKQRLALHQERADVFRELGMRQRAIEELQKVVPLEEELFGSSAVTLEKIHKLEQAGTGHLQSLAQ